MYQRLIKGCRILVVAEGSIIWTELLCVHQQFWMMKSSESLSLLSRSHLLVQTLQKRNRQNLTYSWHKLYSKSDCAADQHWAAVTRIMVFVITCGFLNITFIATPRIICLAIIIRLLCHIKLVISKVSMLLIFNTYVAMFCMNTIMFIFFGFNVYGNMNPGFAFDDPRCNMRVFLAHSSYASFYSSCVLQAIFRLFRVVFYKNKFYPSRQFFVIALVGQWIAS